MACNLPELVLLSSPVRLFNHVCKEKKMTTIDQFIDNFLLAVDFQNTVTVTPESELLSLPEWDSLAALGVIVMFDVDYGKVIVADDLKNCVTLTDLYKLLG